VVVIDKPAVAPPDDPVLAARIESTAQRRQPFTELQLPQAVPAAHSRPGRLIRDETAAAPVLCDTVLGCAPVRAAASCAAAAHENLRAARTSGDSSATNAKERVELA